MIHQVSFQIESTIIVNGLSYEAFIDGNCWINEFKYGEDADGNRYEWVKELSDIEFGNVSYVEDDKDVFIDSSVIENIDDVKERIFEYCKDQL